MGDDGTSDELNRLVKPGANFGFPYCHADGKLDADFKKQDACKGVTLPVALMGAHAAVMGVKFYTGKMFPTEYQNTMIMAQAGRLAGHVAIVTAGGQGLGEAISKEFRA